MSKKSRIWEENPDRIILNVGNGFSLSAKFTEIGTFRFVTVEWSRPDISGYIPHMFFWFDILIEKWNMKPIRSSSNRYKEEDLEELLNDYPELERLFVRNWDSKKFPMELDLDGLQSSTIMICGDVSDMEYD